MRSNVARESVVDVTGTVAAYRVAVRTPENGGGPDADAAGPGVAGAPRSIVGLLLDFGLDVIVGSRPAFVELPPPFLLGELPVPFEPHQVVLEVGPDLLVRPAALAALRQLAMLGYRVAVTDDATTRAVPELAELTSYVLLSAARLTAPDGPDVAAYWQRPGVTLVGTDVTGAAEWEQAQRVGCTLFTGSHLPAPGVVRDQPTLGVQHGLLLQLVGQLLSSDTSIDEIHERVRLDPGLSLRVLRAVNSAAAGLPREVASLREAVLLLGRRQLSNWVLLLVMADATGGDAEEITRMLTRARMCEVLAKAVHEDPDGAFLTGLVCSLVDMLDAGDTQLVAELPLAPVVADAVAHRSGNLGRLLAVTEAYERGETDTAFEAEYDADLSRTYLAALAWSLQICDRAA